MSLVVRRRGPPILYLGEDSVPMGCKKAQALLARGPRVIRHTRAWVDDSELCLVVECRLSDGSPVSVKMSYCWDAEPFRRYNYFEDITHMLLNGDWAGFYAFVQDRFSGALREQATSRVFEEYDSPPEDDTVAEPGAAPDPAT